MFSEEYGEAAVEVLDILDNTNKEDVNKIPKSFIKFLVDNASLEYKVNLDHSKPINELNLKEKTKELLGYIYIKWWCNDKDKEKYMQEIKELEIKREEEKKEKYNPDKIFENRKKEKQNNIIEENMRNDNENNNETVWVVKYKESIFKKIINKIINFFKR